MEGRLRVVMRLCTKSLRISVVVHGGLFLLQGPETALSFVMSAVVLQSLCQVPQ